MRVSTASLKSKFSPSWNLTIEYYVDFGNPFLTLAKWITLKGGNENIPVDLEFHLYSMFQGYVVGTINNDTNLSFQQSEEFKAYFNKHKQHIATIYKEIRS